MIEFDYTLIIQFVNFLLLLILLKFLLFDPILTVMRKRESTITSLSILTEERVREAERMKELYEQALRQRIAPILEEKDLLLSEERREVEAFLEKEKMEIQKTLSSMRRTLAGQERKIIEDLLPSVQRLSRTITERILKEPP